MAYGNNSSYDPNRGVGIDSHMARRQDKLVQDIRSHPLMGVNSGSVIDQKFDDDAIKSHFNSVDMALHVHNGFPEHQAEPGSYESASLRRPANDNYDDRL